MTGVAWIDFDGIEDYVNIGTIEEETWYSICLSDDEVRKIYLDGKLAATQRKEDSE